MIHLLPVVRNSIAAVTDTEREEETSALLQALANNNAIVDVDGNSIGALYIEGDKTYVIDAVKVIQTAASTVGLTVTAPLYVGAAALLGVLCGLKGIVTETSISGSIVCQILMETPGREIDIQALQKSFTNKPVILTNNLQNEFSLALAELRSLGCLKETHLQGKRVIKLCETIVIRR